MTWSWYAKAACTDKPPPYHASDSDVYFSAQADKNSIYDGPSGFVDWKSYYIDRFGIKKSLGWDKKNYGWDVKDDPELPLGRTLAAFFLLHHSDEEDTPDWNSTEGNLLKWMYGYVAGGYNGLDDLRAGGCHDWKAADTNDAFYQDARIIIYQSGFRSNIIARAAILVHENYHYRSGYGHSAGDDMDRDFYVDQYIAVPLGRGLVRYDPNPNAHTPSVYALDALWYLNYFANAKRHTNNHRRNVARGLFIDRIEDKIRDQDTVPEEVRDWMAVRELPEE